MTRHTFVLMICLAGVSIASTSAQQPEPAPQPPRASTPAPVPQRGATPAPPTPQAQPTPPPRRQGQPVNVKIEFVVSDQHSGTAATKRTLSLVVADAMGGSIRTTSEVNGVGGGVPLNIDANPELLPDGKIRLGFTVQYDWPAPIEGADPPRRGTVLKTAVRHSASLILENGKSMLATQSADPIGDRQVTVEVKATILR